MSTKKSRSTAPVATPDRGTKRQCLNCGTKFYDLNRDPIVCPHCGTVFAVTSAKPSGRAKPEEQARSEPKVEVVEVDKAAAEAGAEIVSLEDAEDPDSDDDNGDEDIPEVEDVEEVEDIGDDDDDTFLEEEEEEDGNFDVPVDKVEER